jgi:hypothetical protein
MNSFGVFWVFLKEKTDDSFHLRRGAEQKYPGTIVITPSCTNVPVGLGNRSNYVKQVSNKEGDFIIINSPPPQQNSSSFFLLQNEKGKKKFFYSTLHTKALMKVTKLFGVTRYC